MSASSCVVTAPGGVMLVTHVIPAALNAATLNSAEKHKLIRRRLEALGTVQIMIGLMVFLFGIVMFPHSDTLQIYSGIFIWGAVSYITAGSLTVVTGTSLDGCLVKSTLIFSVVAVGCSCVSTVIYVLDAAVLIQTFTAYDLYSSFELYQIRSRGVSGVLAVFSFLVFLVSICVAILSCKASCQSSDQPIVMINQSNEVTSNPSETPPTPQAPPLEQTPPPSDNYETVKEYNSII